MSQPRPLVVLPSPIGGRGVFATCPIPEGDVVERCPTIQMFRKHVAGLLNDYVYSHPRDPESVLIGLGFCSLYNHQDSGTATLSKRVVGEELVLTANRDIMEGEELTHNYGESWWEKRQHVKRVGRPAHGTK